MQAKKIALCALLGLVNVSFADTPNIENIANTPCGQKDCPCPKKLKLARGQKELQQNDIDQNKVKQEKLKQKIQHLKKRLYTKEACFTVGVLLASANIIANECLSDNAKQTQTARLLLEGSYSLGLIISAFGAFFGYNDYMKLQEKNEQLEKLNS